MHNHQKTTILSNSTRVPKTRAIFILQISLQDYFALGTFLITAALL